MVGIGIEKVKSAKSNSIIALLKEQWKSAW